MKYARSRHKGRMVSLNDLDAVARLHREAGFVASSADAPVSAHALYDAKGRLRRISSLWPDGWSCLTWLRADGSASQSWKLCLMI